MNQRLARVLCTECREAFQPDTATLKKLNLPAGVDSFDHLLEIFLDRAGVDGLFTDFPDKARRYIDSRTQESC